VKTTGNTVLITGGSAGIGLAFASELLRRGNRVVITGRSAERFSVAKEKLGDVATIINDVSREEDRRRLAAVMSERFPDLNVLVNNAGIQHTFDFTSGERGLETMREEIETNLVAPIHLTQLFVPHLSRQAESAVVNVTSGLAFAPIARMPIYCATKAALHSLSLSMRHQLRNTSIRLFELAPPIVATELGKSHRPPEMNRTAMSVEDCAAAMIEAMENDRFETPIGPAVGMRAKREELFEAMNNR
jgi:uncharacterized oxidoreductase